MAERVFLHVGTPKTGTTYLQTLMWLNRPILRRQGVLFPGDRRADHLYASLVVRGARRIERRHPEAPSSWERLQRQIRAWKGTAVVSHEFFGAASAEQARAVTQALEPAEVHLVVTARDLVSLFPSMWQEHVKFKATVPLTEFAMTEPDDPLAVWGWRTMDAAGVLRRWAQGVPVDRVHVITMPDKGSPRDVLWQRFAELVGIDPSSCDASGVTPNDSLGLVEVELMRRVNEHLTDTFTTPRAVGRWLRGFFARDILVPHDGRAFGPSPEQLVMLQERSEAIVEYVQSSGFDVIGDLARLTQPGVAGLPQPADVTDSELLAAATLTIAELLDEVRRRSS